MKAEKILLGHGSGGRLSHELIENLFMKSFCNPLLNLQGDSTPLKLSGSEICFTTDSFVVDPLFFPGGDIGKLAVCGTINDLAVSGAEPWYLSCGFIIEEGFPMKNLKLIVESMKREARLARVEIVTGDTKVVDKGKCDKIFINTAGIGMIRDKNRERLSRNSISVGDKIIVNGTIGDHGMSIMAARNFDTFQTSLTSDCASLNHLIKKVLDASDGVRFMRDATRGGIATVLTEVVENETFGIEINEQNVPVSEEVRGMCDMLGLDPFYVANEGKIILIVAKEEAKTVLKTLRRDTLGKNSAIIGEVVDVHPGKVGYAQK